MRKNIASAKTLILILLCMAVLTGVFATPAFAADTTVSIEGKVFSFEDNDHYEYSSSAEFEVSAQSNTYGQFKIVGELAEDGTKSGIPVFSVGNEKVSFIYSYSDQLLKADEESWHLVDDRSKKVDGLTLKNNIMKGAIVLQSSKDGVIWSTDVELTNAFSDTPTRTDSFYSPNSIQLSNGCYYRLIVVYKTSRKTGTNQILGIPTTSKFEYSKTAEVYEFYLHDRNQTTNENEKSRGLGELVNTGLDNGYSKSNQITISDPHYGWELGQFFVSGYTREAKSSTGDPVFLKNLGDQVILWFNLKQDIDKLNDSEILSINEDTNGYDQFFQTPKINMGRGTLIIRYTDENGVVHDPEIYTNYLEANAKTSADTVVKLFEEGDYDVALDYEIKKTPRVVVGLEIIPVYSNYRIHFSFSVRNGNCMVYPLDVKTGSELTNESFTENGFKLDLNKSRYLIVDVEKSIVTQGVNGYEEVKDVRFNRAAKDGEAFIEEGIYTFTVKNPYLINPTIKKIYVGSADYMKALAVNNISVTELNNRVSLGGIIEPNGNIAMPTPTPEPTPEQMPEVTPDASINDDTSNEQITESVPEQMPEVTPDASINNDTSNEQTTESVETAETNATENTQITSEIENNNESTNNADTLVNDDVVQEKNSSLTVLIVFGAIVILGAICAIVVKKKTKG